MTAIAEWAAEAPQPVRAALGARRDAPGHYSVPTETTIRRTLGCLDPQALRYAARRVPREVLLEAWSGEPRLLERLLGSSSPVTRPADREAPRDAPGPP